MSHDLSFESAWTAAPLIPTNSWVHSPPLISILLPFKNKPDLLKQCLDKVLAYEAEYPHFEVIGIDHESTCPETQALMQTYEQQDARIHFTRYEGPFNYSAMNNQAAKQAKGEYLLLLNNDIELLTPNWLPQLLSHAAHSTVGAVGSLLYYPNETIQHAGIALGIFGSCGHLHKGMKKGELGFANMLSQPRLVSAVTGACVMVKTDRFWAVGGLDETVFSIGFNDVDLCLKLNQSGYQTVFTPQVEAIHHESVTRAKHKCGQVAQRERTEVEAFQQRYRHLLEAGDPYYPHCRTLLDESMQAMPTPELRGVFKRWLYVRLLCGWHFRVFKQENAWWPKSYLQRCYHRPSTNVCEAGSRSSTILPQAALF